MSRSSFCQQILKAYFCHQQICFSTANVYADIMEMTLTPAYSVSRQPAVSWWKSFAFVRRVFSLLSRFHLCCRTFLIYCDVKRITSVNLYTGVVGPFPRTHSVPNNLGISLGWSGRRISRSFIRCIGRMDVDVRCCVVFLRELCVFVTGLRGARWIGSSAGCVPCIVWPSVDSAHLSDMLLSRFSRGVVAIDGGPTGNFAVVCLKWYFNSCVLVDPKSGWESEWSESVESQQIPRSKFVDRLHPCICGERCCFQARVLIPWVSRLWEPCMFCFVPLIESFFQCWVYPLRRTEAISLIVCIPGVVDANQLEFAHWLPIVTFHWGGEESYRFGRLCIVWVVVDSVPCMRQKLVCWGDCLSGWWQSWSRCSSL